MTEPKLEIDQRCDRIEAAIGTLADNLGEGEIVRTILYGGGESREEGDVTPEELDRSHVIARGFHAAYERLAPSYGFTTRHPIAMLWENTPDQNKLLMVAVVAELLDKGIIQDRQMNAGS